MRAISLAALIAFVTASSTLGQSPVTRAAWWKICDTHPNEHDCYVIHERLDGHSGGTIVKTVLRMGRAGDRLELFVTLPKYAGSTDELHPDGRRMDVYLPPAWTQLSAGTRIEDVQSSAKLLLSHLACPDAGSCDAAAELSPYVIRLMRQGGGLLITASYRAVQIRFPVPLAGLSEVLEDPRSSCGQHCDPTRELPRYKRYN